MRRRFRPFMVILSTAFSLLLMGASVAVIGLRPTPTVPARLESPELKPQLERRKGAERALLKGPQELPHVLAPLNRSTRRRNAPCCAPTGAGPSAFPALWLMANAQTSDLNVPLTVRETAGITRTAEPVTSGIPLPFGAVTDTNELWLAGPDGITPVPAQFTVLSRWNGPVTDTTKAIKWVLVDFQADVPANTSVTYYLHTTPDWQQVIQQPSIVDQVPATCFQPGWMSWNVTPLAREWLRGTRPNHGLLLMGTAQNNNLHWRSAEYAADPSQRPRLVLVFGQGGTLPLTLENERLRLHFRRQTSGSEAQQQSSGQAWGLALGSATVKPTGYTFRFDLDDLWAVTLRATDGTTTTVAPSTASYTLTVVTGTTGPTQTLTAVWQVGQGDEETRGQGDHPIADCASVVEPDGNSEIRNPKSPPLPLSLSPCLSTGGLTVTVTVTLGPGAPYALWTVAVDNRYPDRAVYHVDFPRLKVQPVGTPGTNRAAVPYFGGRLIEDPIHSVALNALFNLPPFFLYPHMYAPLQLFTYFDTAEGHALYLAAHDGGGYTKAFDFRADGQRLYFGVRQFPEYNITPGNDYTAPYPAAIGALPGDWYDAAKAYRAWAQGQVWMQRGPIALSDDFSAKLKNSEIMGIWAPFTDTVKPFEGLAQDMERWAQFLGIEHVAGLWYGWHGNEFDTGWPEYEPVEPSFPAGMTLTHQLGNYAWPYINPTVWDTATASYTATHAADYAMKDEFGHVQTITSTKGAVFAVMDPATAFWQGYVRDWVLELQQNYAVDGVYLDVWSGSGYGFDYDASHGHPTGGGNYIAQGMRTQGQMIRQATRANDPEFIMMSEHPGEFFLDLLEIENVEYVGPVNPAGWWTLPLFNTVYHDYIMMSTFVNTSFQVPDSPDNEAALSWMWAVRYTQGNLLAVNGDGASVLRDPPETTPNYAAYLFLRELVQSYAFAAPYLRYGERLRDLPTEVPMRQPPGPNGVPFAIAPYSLQQPVILSSVWRSVTDDRIGLVFTNWTTATQTITYTFDPGEYGLPAGHLGLYRLDANGPHLLTSFNGPITRTETLPAHSVLVLMVAPCPHPYDLSKNGSVGIEDIMFIAANWHAPNPDPRADVNADGYVDVVDVMRVAAEWGQVCP